MKALILSDKEFRTKQYEALSELVIGHLKKKGFETEEYAIGREDLAFCMGCFGCWVKKPGECVISDQIASINYKYINSDVTIYLSPVIFGQFSANIKNALDRWLPNILPFFERRPDGSTIHPGRYKSYAKQIIIGYGDDLEPEDAKLFEDIIKKHRRNTEVLIYSDSSEFLQELEKIELRKVGSRI